MSIYRQSIWLIGMSNSSITNRQCLSYYDLSIMRTNLTRWARRTRSCVRESSVWRKTLAFGCFKDPSGRATAGTLLLTLICRCPWLSFDQNYCGFYTETLNNVTSIWWLNNSIVAQDWETETLDIDMGRISNDDDLGLDLAGGRCFIHTLILD